MEDVITALDGTLRETISANLRRYLQLNRNSKFIILSDYCLDDRKKPNRVASFTILPNDFEFTSYSNYLGEISSKDLKNCRSIKPDFIKHISEKRIFSISFIFEDLKGLTDNSMIAGKFLVNERIDNTISMINKWTRKQPYNKDNHKSFIKKLNSIKSNINSKTPNLNLYRSVTIISLLAGYLAYMLTKEANAITVGWFSDRDKIIEAWDGVAIDMFSANHNALCERNGIHSSKTKLFIGNDGGNSGALWFDNFNRIPDHLAGTLASWDIKNNTLQRGKHVDILRNCFADNDFCSIVQIAITPESSTFSRIVVSKNPITTEAAI
ncbi:MAG: hypothetical protein WBD81_15665 [Collimonas pratensis]|uniref:hypothetical protein n=1 Tax=Collimonas pratensis TaxID=279113 RepID=UPI003C793C13